MGGIAPFEEGLRTFLGGAASAVEVGGRLGAELPFFKLWGGGGAEPPFYFRRSRIY